MKVVFVSNYFNHHQKPLCDALYGICGNDFAFVETKDMSPERKKLGWKKPEQSEYVINYCYDEERANNLILNSDILIAGESGINLDRIIRNNKLCFKYQERPIRQKNIIKAVPRMLKWHYQNPGRKRVYLLCASAYTAYDYSRYGLFRGKTFKWGYFPETRYYDIDALLNEKETKSIVWCGRFITCKHVEDAIAAAELLKNEGYSFALKIIGSGENKSATEELVERKGMRDCVTFLGSMSTEEVRKQMECAGVFMLTSDFQEGWGAVLNEAMNSGCAVVASHAAGSTPFLVNDTVNGLIYKSGDVDELYRKVKQLLDNTALQRQLGAEAYRTITEEWNGEKAAERLIKLAEEIMSGNEHPNIYSSGPCSVSEIYPNDWIERVYE